MNTLRYLKLQNDGAFVAQIVMEYRERHTDGQGDPCADSDDSHRKPHVGHFPCRTAKSFCRDIFHNDIISYFFEKDKRKAAARPRSEAAPPLRTLNL